MATAEAKVAAWLAEGRAEPDAPSQIVDLHSQVMCQAPVNQPMVQLGCEGSVEGSVTENIMDERLPQQVY